MASGTIESPGCTFSIRPHDYLHERHGRSEQRCDGCARSGIADVLSETAATPRPRVECELRLHRCSPRLCDRGLTTVEAGGISDAHLITLSWHIRDSGRPSHLQRATKSKSVAAQLIRDSSCVPSPWSPRMSACHCSNCVEVGCHIVQTPLRQSFALLLRCIS